MELKTKITAEEGRQDLLISREFDLPVELLFKAFTEAELVEQWMGTKVLKLESKRHGSWQFETSDAKGNVVFKADGTIHEFSPNCKITRTFEMANAPFGVQLELLNFEKLTDATSRINMHVIYESNDQRDQMLKLPFAQGINMAHNRLQDVAGKLKTIG
ncbi:ATPase [Mucilaginibacter sp. 14171R-50]|uniref:SRPBCC family protein n=1 Tax=Mucilaginibacter sp. 14171R-50 TaxID=2703789 RepID=UPI00138D37DA|nr:SRPBCC domain-containing protein [Mucilaginibacter sp. 14171R-50]QHS55737.1 ATPase [Mucilaginibacter sp. 14171R-50]